MTPTNPLAQFLSWSPETEEQDQRRLVDFVNGSVAEQPKPAKPDDDTDVLQNAFRGFLTTASQTGEMPDANTFDQRWRKNNSPAREFLANFFTGVSDSLAGRQFRSVKEKAFQQERAVVEEKQRAQQLRQQVQMQMANMIQNEIQSRRDTEMKGQLAAIKNIADQNKQMFEMLKFQKQYGLDERKTAVLEDRLKADQVKADRENELKQWEAQDTGNGLFDAARRQVSAQLRAQGVDLTSAAGQRQLWEETAKTWQGYEEVKAKYNRKAVGQGPLPYIMQIMNPDGQQGIALFDRRTGQPMGGQFVGRKVTPEMLKNANDLRAASQSLRTAMTLARDSKDGIGTFIQMLPQDMRSKLGALPTDERQIRAFVANGISTFIRSQTGLAATDAERKFITQGVPELWEKPENFFPGMAAMTTIFDSMAMRSQHGLELDLTPALQKYSALAKKYIKEKGSAQGLPIPTAEETLQEAAKMQGKVLRRNVWGTLEVANDAR